MECPPGTEYRGPVKVEEKDGSFSEKPAECKIREPAKSLVIQRPAIIVQKAPRVIVERTTDDREIKKLQNQVIRLNAKLGKAEGEVVVAKNAVKTVKLAARTAKKTVKHPLKTLKKILTRKRVTLKNPLTRTITIRIPSTLKKKPLGFKARIKKVVKSIRKRFRG